MLIELAEAYVKALNGGKVPTIENAWNYMQASELERAFKEVITEHDNKCNSLVDPQLPMSEEQLKEIIQKVKNEAFENFKGKVLGDLNNAKGKEYIEKLRKAFKKKYETI